ncbi:M12 family metallo-peptidase [Yersinia bercovieri]|uniref:M12 family metallo-peptidase n=1 Tax=Yersinia bercovieri TaxID=634 RepID=UPI0011AA4D07|nr:M12 family metallo-peptidase [Yersinia bercovieri]
MNSTFLSVTSDQLGCGSLPSGYDEIIFELSEGKPVYDIFLPDYPADNSRVVIRSSATWDAMLHLPFTSVKVKPGSEYSLEYQSDIQQWSIKGTDINYLTPNSDGNITPDNPSHLTCYSMDDSNHADEVTLPTRAEDGDIIVISSTAEFDSKISGVNRLNKEEKTLKRGDHYIFRYQSKCNGTGWVLDSLPIQPQEDISDESPDSEVFISYIDDSDEVVKFTYDLSDDNWTDEIVLPTQPTDKCKVEISSSAAKNSTLNLPFGSLSIKNGDQYFLEYHADTQQWSVKGTDIDFLTPNSGGHTPPAKQQTNISNESLGSTPDVTDGVVSEEVDINVNNEEKQKRKARPIANPLSTTPNKLKSGLLPSGHSEVEFKLSDGNWTRDIFLPLQPEQGDRVVIQSVAGYNAYLHLPFSTIEIKTGSKYSLEYREDIQQWNIQGTDINFLTPDSVGNTIPDKLKGITYYMMESYNWVPEIRLPAAAEDGALIIIRSAATNSEAKIAAEHLLYNSTSTIKSGDQYVLKYLKKFNGWVFESAPIRRAEFDSTDGEIPYPTGKNTLVDITDSHWLAKIKLPEQAGDRDKITLKSSTDKITIIDTTHINDPGVMKLRNGEQYDFFYIAENGKWQLISSPDTVYQSQDILSGEVPELRTPRTIINISTDNYQPELRLPTNPLSGSRVIINSDAESDISVSAGKENYKVSQGETVAFKVDEQGLWFRETVTIDMLLLYSDKAADKFGEDVIRAQLIEELNITNEALENSGANFRYRMVGLRQIEAKAHWSKLGHPLRDLRDDTLVQEWRDTLKADGIYYKGTEDGCGLSWLGTHNNSKNMVATGSTNCGKAVMRHEMGHNMGLKHYHSDGSYNAGYGLLSTIMADNSIPYYSTPNRYTADYGIPMGIVGAHDAVRAMNERSAAVAGYR